MYILSERDAYDVVILFFRSFARRHIAGGNRDKSAAVAAAGGESPASAPAHADGDATPWTKQPECGAVRQGRCPRRCGTVKKSAGEDAAAVGIVGDGELEWVEMNWAGGRRRGRQQGRRPRR